MKTLLLWLSLLSSSCLVLAQEKTSYPLTSSSPQPAVTVAPLASPAPLTMLALSVQGGGASASAEGWGSPYAPYFGPRVAGFVEGGYTAAGSLMSAWELYGSVGAYLTPFFYIGVGMGASQYKTDRVGWLLPMGVVLRGRWPLSRQLGLWVDGRPALGVPSKLGIHPGFYGTVIGGLEIGYFSVGLGVTTCRVTIDTDKPLGWELDRNDGEVLSGTGLTLRVGVHF